MTTSISTWEARIRESYAHNSRVYSSLAQEASLEEIVSFLCWDAHQPAFTQFLGHWIDRVPPSAKAGLCAHIVQEEDEAHADLFKVMLNGLLEKTPLPEIDFDVDVLKKLNYVFSEECSSEQDAGFFLGVFLATELMSQKRCQQILDGLRRCGNSDDLEYLRVHAVADCEHFLEVYDEMIVTSVEAGEMNGESVDRGIDYRLESSGDYLKWYADRYL